MEERNYELMEKILKLASPEFREQQLEERCQFVKNLFCAHCNVGKVDYHVDHTIWQCDLYPDYKGCFQREAVDELVKQALIVGADRLREHVKKRREKGVSE